MGLNEKEETQKLYYSISEVSDMFELNASTLRFWEKEFEVLSPTKNKKGNRLFTQKDIDNIALIVELVKLKGFTIQGAKEQIRQRNLSKPQTNTNAEIIDKLKRIKAQLIEMRDRLSD